jgi:hypothetical protein
MGSSINSNQRRTFGAAEVGCAGVEERCLEAEQDDSEQLREALKSESD